MTALIFMKLESERVPLKNLREVGGKPLFYWIFDALTRSRYVSRIILNTDSERIAEAVSGRFDVKIHMRPDHLLTIRSNEANQLIDYDLSQDDSAYYLQTHSTNPLLTGRTMDEAVECFFERALPAGHDSLFSVTAHRKRFFFSDGRPVNHDPARLIKTQELEPMLEENSCIYIFSRESFYANGVNRLGRQPYLHPIPALEALDIDTEDDLAQADLILRGAEEKAGSPPDA